MKLISFRHGANSGYGILGDKGIIDAGRKLRDHADLASVLATPEKLTALAGDPPDFALADVELLPPITRPRIICIGLNYKSHIAEMGRDTPGYPILFTRYPESVVASGQALVRPRLSEKFDYEGELAFVIGKPGRHVDHATALDHVAGYSCFNDGSIRDYQFHTSQFVAGKNFERSGGFGPWIVTSDEVGDVGSLKLFTRLNGKVMQEARLDDLLFGVADLIAYISQVFTLLPGDVIATGTTGGVGAAQKPPLWMRPGDRIEVEIERIGTLSNPVIAEEGA